MLSTEQNPVALNLLPNPNFSTRAEQYYRLILLQWKHHTEHASVFVIFSPIKRSTITSRFTPLLKICFFILLTFPCSGCLYSGRFKNYECASLWHTHTSSHSAWLWLLTEMSTSITSAKYCKYPEKEALFQEYRNSQHLRFCIQVCLLLLSLDVRGNNMKFIHKALHIWLTEKVFNVFSSCKSLKIFLLELCISIISAYWQQPCISLLPFLASLDESDKLPEPKDHIFGKH